MLSTFSSFLVLNFGFPSLCHCFRRAKSSSCSKIRTMRRMKTRTRTTTDEKIHRRLLLWSPWEHLQQSYTVYIFLLFLGKKWLLLLPTYMQNPFLGRAIPEKEPLVNLLAVEPISKFLSHGYKFGLPDGNLLFHVLFAPRRVETACVLTFFQTTSAVLSLSCASKLHYLQ